MVTGSFKLDRFKHYCFFSIGGSRGGREGRTPPPGRPNSFNFMQFSGKFGVFTPPLEGSRPPSGKSWIRHCSVMISSGGSRIFLRVGGLGAPTPKVGVLTCYFVIFYYLKPHENETIWTLGASLALPWIRQ